MDILIQVGTFLSMFVAALTLMVYVGKRSIEKYKRLDDKVREVRVRLGRIQFGAPTPRQTQEEREIARQEINCEEGRHRWLGYRVAHVRRKRGRDGVLKKTFQRISRRQCDHCKHTEEEDGRGWRKVDPVYFEIANADEHVKGRRLAKIMLNCQACKESNMTISGIITSPTLTYAGNCQRCRAVGYFNWEDMRWVCVPPNDQVARFVQSQLNQKPTEPEKTRSNRSINL